jgi:hypothetical protein
LAGAKFKAAKKARIYGLFSAVLQASAAFNARIRFNAIVGTGEWRVNNYDCPINDPSCK